MPRAKITEKVCPCDYHEGERLLDIVHFYVKTSGKYGSVSAWCKVCTRIKKLIYMRAKKGQKCSIEEARAISSKTITIIERNRHAPPGMAWCTVHAVYEPLANFAPHYEKRNGRQSRCRRAATEAVQRSQEKARALAMAKATQLTCVTCGTLFIPTYHQKKTAEAGGEVACPTHKKALRIAQMHEGVRRREAKKVRPPVYCTHCGKEILNPTSSQRLRFKRNQVVLHRVTCLPRYNGKQIRKSLEKHRSKQGLFATPRLPDAPIAPVEIPIVVCAVCNERRQISHEQYQHIKNSGEAWRCGIHAMRSLIQEPESTGPSPLATAYFAARQPVQINHYYGTIGGSR